MNLLEKQLNAVYYLKDNVTTELIYGGAAGGGKSALGCLWLIEMCQKYEGSRWLMGRSRLKNLKETTLETFFELSSSLGISNQYNYNAQANIITWSNGSQIFLKDLFTYPSDKNFDSLGSLEITGAFIDECNQIDFKAWQVVKSRIRFKLKEFGLIPKLLGTCNPSKNWVYKNFYLPSTKSDLLEYRAFIKALPTDNPHLAPSYLESLLQMEKNSCERLYYGNWEYDDDPSSIIEQDAINDYFAPNHISIENPKHKYITCDVARKGKDKTVIRIWFDWICIDRFEIPVCTLDEIANKIKELQTIHAIPTSKVLCDEDGVGGGLVDMLKCKGFINNSSPAKGENYASLKDQCSILMGKKIMSRECGEKNNESKVIDLVSEEMAQIKYKDLDKDGKLRIQPKDWIKEQIGRSPDDWDSIMMRYYFELYKPFTIDASG